METIEKNSPKKGENKVELYQVSEAAAQIVKQETGISFSEMRTTYREFYKARVLYAGILSSFEIPAGKIAQLMDKKTFSVNGYIAEFDRGLNRSGKFQRMVDEVKAALNIKDK